MGIHLHFIAETKISTPISGDAQKLRVQRGRYVARSIGWPAAKNRR